MIIVSGVALVYDEAFAARVGGEPYEGGAEDPGADDDEVISVIYMNAHIRL